jgi:hypothetical protein
MQLAPLKETNEVALVKHEAHGRDVKKTTTRSSKGGYLGFIGGEINEFVAQLIWTVLFDLFLPSLINFYRV